MRYFSMFSGIGGFELGIQQAYEDKENLRTIKKQKDTLNKWDKFLSSSKRERQNWDEYSTCIGYSEIDKYAIQVYEKHFPKHKNYGDCTKIIASKIPDYDLLIGGFPCQAFSIAGKRGGFKDTRGTLFFDIARILKIKRPKNFVLENVKGLLSHNQGDTFATIISTIDELGYDCQWSVLNSKNFGVPQNRERVFIVGHLRGTSRPKVFPIRESNQVGSIQQPRKKDKKGEVAQTITATYWKGGKGSQIADFRYDEGLRIRKNNISPTLKARGREKDITGSPIVLARSRYKYNELRKVKGNPTLRSIPGQTLVKVVASRGRHLVKGKRKDILGAKTKQRLEARKDELTNTLTSVEKDNWLSDGMKIRRLTPTECERLQGFPDGWTEGISDTQRYKTLGNAVTVNVVREIVKKLYESSIYNRTI